MTHVGCVSVTCLHDIHRIRDHDVHACCKANHHVRFRTRSTTTRDIICNFGAPSQLVMGFLSDERSLGSMREKPESMPKKVSREGQHRAEGLAGF